MFIKGFRPVSEPIYQWRYVAKDISKTILDYIGTDTMHGQLPLAVMRLLAAQPLSGYALMKRLSATGWKPSPGSMYPLLQSLREKGRLDVQQKCRSKVYSLTPEGRKELVALSKNRDAIIEKTLDQLSSVCASKTAEWQAVFGGKALDAVFPEAMELKRSVLIALVDGKDANKIRAILRDTIAKLKRLP